MPTLDRDTDTRTNGHRHGEGHRHRYRHGQHRHVERHGHRHWTLDRDTDTRTHGHRQGEGHRHKYRQGHGLATTRTAIRTLTLAYIVLPPSRDRGGKKDQSYMPHRFFFRSTGYGLYKVQQVQFEVVGKGLDNCDRRTDFYNPRFAERMANQ
jgi:hypothetical protein